MAALIEDYALLGNCRTAALVDREGSIDWLCFPRFDAPACFASLLGEGDNGYWRIRPRGTSPARQRRYQEGTLILETTFQTETGRAMLIDFMPLADHSSVVRIVAGLQGQVDFDMELVVRFDYGRSIPWVERPEPGVLTAVAGPDKLVLRSDTPLQAQDFRTLSRFSVRVGERRVYSLTHQQSDQPLQNGFDAEAALVSTAAQWRRFSDRCPEVGKWSAQVKRSLITLKALTYQPTGGIVAAPTTSLPEQPGGDRNWDYRYCWLRDAAMTLLAFMNLGYFQEAGAWREWLLRSVAGDPGQMQIMYGLGGERRLPEYTLPWLGGYVGSRPVRVGNAAASQLQLDVFGELADALTQAVSGGLPRHPRSKAIVGVIAPFLEEAWRTPDCGIWEIRAEPKHFTHSKVMAWVFFDRLARQAEAEGEPEQAMRHRAAADSIHAEVCARAYDPGTGSFMQSYGSMHVDASLLQIALTGFLPAQDPRVVGTVALIEERLMRDGLLLRYDSEYAEDGLAPGEGTFLVCSFWLADVYVLLGRHADARRLFERLISLCNDVGLLSEQYDPYRGRMLGNFPQAFSHIGIINTALNLSRTQGPSQERVSANVQPQ